MKQFIVIVIAALMTSGMPTAGARQGAAEAEKLLASAKHKATIDGDPKGAIEEYKRAFAAAGSNRGLAAEALLRMAECHQQLGEAEAQAIYERVIRDYADQKDAAVLARARHRGQKAGHASEGRSGRCGRASTPTASARSRRDGRFLTYTDWKNGAALALRDLTTGTNLPPRVRRADAVLGDLEGRAAGRRTQWYARWRRSEDAQELRASSSRS